MANNLFVSYDLHEPGKNYEAVIEAIKALGNWAKVHYSLWYVNSNLTAKQVAERVRATMDANDKLLVIDASNNDAYWYNLDTEVSDFIQQNWHK